MHTDQLFDNLANEFRNGTVAVWCGAGVSIPSGIPAAIPLVHALLRRASLSSAQRERIAAIVPHVLPFERLIEVILDSMDETAQSGLLKLFQIGEPSGYHRFFAKLSTVGCLKTICTTNFDTHIESAFASEETPLVVHDDPRIVSEPEVGGRRTQLFKVHGSASNVETMAVTVRRVAAPGSGQYLRRLIEKIFAGSFSHVLVLGYSFSDRFDISPFVREFGKNSKTHVLWVDHAGHRSEDHGQPSTPPPSHPLASYRHVTKLRYSTASFIQALCSCLKLGRIGSCSRTPGVGQWRSFLREFFAELDKKNHGVVARHLAGSFLRMVGADAEAATHFRIAVKKARRLRDDRSLLVLLQDLGGCEIRTHNPDAALKTLREAASVAGRFESGCFKDHALSQLGSAYKDLGDACYFAARSHFEEALSTARQSQDAYRCVPHLAGLAAAWLKIGDIDAAKQAYESALSSLSGTGDIYREAELRGNVAGMALIVRDYATATAWYEEALRLSKLAGDTERVGIHTMNLASTAAKQGRRKEAIRLYDEAEGLLGEVTHVEHPTLALLRRQRDYVAQLQSVSSKMPEK